MGNVIATFDYETDPFKFGRVPKPFTCGFYDGDTYTDFWGSDCTEQFIEFLTEWVMENKNEKMTVYAHNGGKFDFFYLLEHLDDDLFIINGRIAKASMFDGQIEFRDSLLILPMPLSAHDKDSISYDLFESELREKHKNEILKYQRKDCVSLHEWVSMFREKFGNGLTLAGAAFKQLKKTSYQVANTFDNFDSMFRNFYYGGRVQCFEVGDFTGDFQYVDINSAYPFAMLSQHWSGSKYIEQDTLPGGDNGSWYAEIDAVSKGALPIRGQDGKLYYPDDDTVRRYMATGWEINTGIKTKTLEIVKVIIVFRPLFTQDFAEYVKKFSAMKSEADRELRKAKESGDKVAIKYWSTQRMFAKLMLNSCYGKFGQDGRRFEKFCIHPFGEMPTDGLPWEPYSETDDFTIFSRPDPVDRFYNVATAASITGWVRAYLWEAICNSDRPLYCDTDSIICEKFNGEIGTELGQWDLEAKPTDVYIAQRKMYAMRLDDGATKTASKGVRLTFDQIKNGVLNGSQIITERDAPIFSLKKYQTTNVNNSVDFSHKFGARFLPRKTNFENIEKNACRNPEENA